LCVWSSGQQDSDERLPVQQLWGLYIAGMQSNKIEIRRATESDIAVLAHFYQSVIRETYTGSVPEKVIAKFTTELLADEWKAFFENKKGIGLLLFIDGELSGFCNSTQSDFPDVDVRLESIYVRKALMGEKYGSLLFLNLVEDFLNCDFKSLHLWVLDKNLQAR
jgi:hypothetical protein